MRGVLVKGGVCGGKGEGRRGARPNCSHSASYGCQSAGATPGQSAIQRPSEEEMEGGEEEKKKKGGRGGLAGIQAPPTPLPRCFGEGVMTRWMFSISHVIGSLTGKAKKKKEQIFKFPCK